MNTLSRSTYIDKLSLPFRLLLYLSLVFPVSAQPDQSFHSLADIERAVHQFITDSTVPSGRSSGDASNEPHVTTRALDQRLRLAACSEPLQTAWSPGSRNLGRVTVRVSCPAPKPWRIHVQATVTMEREVWVLARGVQQGEVLTQELLTRQTVQLGSRQAGLNGQSHPVSDIEQWIGFTFTRRVGSGQLLDEQMLKAPNLVRKGEEVIITHSGKGLTLHTTGIALTDATLNQQVKVRNTTSGRVVNAIVIGRNTVRTLL